MLFDKNDRIHRIFRMHRIDHLPDTFMYCLTNTLVGAACLLAIGAAPSAPAPTSRLAFASKRDGNWEIYVADAGRQTRLTMRPVEDRFPLWSPDGSRIAFISGRDGPSSLYVMPAAGGAATRLTTQPTLTPSWQRR